MKIGVVLPQTEIGNDPAAIKAYAGAVEDMGFTHILVFGRGRTRIATPSTSRSCSSASWPPPRAGSSW